MKLHMYHSTRGQSIIEDVAPVNATFISQWSKESANSLSSVQKTIEPKMAIVPHVHMGFFQITPYMNLETIDIIPKQLG